MKKRTIVLMTLVLLAVASCFAQEVNVTDPIPSNPMAQPLVALTDPPQGIVTQPSDSVAPAPASDLSPPGPLQGLWNWIVDATNAAAGGGYLKGLSGGRNIAFVDYAKNFAQTSNGFAGVVVAYDYAWADRHGIASEASMFRGGFSVGAKLYPFATFGATKFWVEVGVFSMAGTVLSGVDKGKLSAINGGFVTHEWCIYKQIYIDVGLIYQNRTEEGFYGGNYGGGFFQALWKPLKW